MVSYEWGLGPLDVRLSEDGLTNVVYGVHWSLSAIDGDYTASSYGSVGVPPPETADFTPYDQLTKEQVEGWVVAALGQEQVDVMKANLAKQIDLQKNPVEASLQPPWSN